MEKLFKAIYNFADLVRAEIYEKIKVEHPCLKPWQIWAKYDPWNETLQPFEYLKVKGRKGSFLPRLVNYKRLEFWAEFKSFSEMGKFLDYITDDKNAVIDLEDESWKLKSIETDYDGVLFEDKKYPEILCIYELEE